MSSAIEAAFDSIAGGIRQWSIIFKWRNQLYTLKQSPIDPTSTTILQLKHYIEMETQVPPARQKFIGLAAQKPNSDESTAMFCTLVTKQAINIKKQQIMFTLMGTVPNTHPNYA